MNSRRKSTVASKTNSKGEWLSIVNALDRLMKARISEDEGVVLKNKRAFNERMLAALNVAYAATLRYYAELLGGDARNLKTEAVISGLWKEAGRLIRSYDPSLSARLTARGGCWSQESTWEPETIKKAWPGLNSIRVSANIMKPDRKAQRWSMLASG